MRSEYLIDHLLGLHVYTYPFQGKIEARVPRPQGFTVSEILLGSESCRTLFQRCISNTTTISSTEFPIATVVIQKVNISTLDAARLLSKAMMCRDYEYLGLKDTNAVAYQVLLLYNCKRPTKIYRSKNLTACIISESIPLQHEGNEFSILIELEDKSCVQELLRRVAAVSRGLLNFFGYQRFGILRPLNHELGKLLLLDMEELAIRVLCTHYRRSIPRRGYEHRICVSGQIPHFLKVLFLESYQSYLFNRALSMLWIDTIDSLDPRQAVEALRGMLIPIPGYRSIKRVLRSMPRLAALLDSVLSVEGFTIKEFEHFTKRKRLPGAFRRAVVTPQFLKVEALENAKVLLEFRLPSGSYATILLREILRCEPTKYAA